MPRLALVRAQGGDLAREGRGHIHVAVRVRSGGDPDLAYGPGAPGREVNIVRVGRDGKHPADLRVIQHARHPKGAAGYSSGTRVGVALVRVSFLKKAGAATRQ